MASSLRNHRKLGGDTADEIQDRSSRLKRSPRGKVTYFCAYECCCINPSLLTVQVSSLFGSKQIGFSQAEFEEISVGGFFSSAVVSFKYMTLKLIQLLFLVVHIKMINVQVVKFPGKLTRIHFSQSHVLLLVWVNLRVKSTMTKPISLKELMLCLCRPGMSELVLSLLFSPLE